MTYHIDIEALRDAWGTLTAEEIIADMNAVFARWRAELEAFNLQPGQTQIIGTRFHTLYVDEYGMQGMGRIARVEQLKPAPKLQALRNRLALASVQRNKVLIRDLERQIGAIS